MFSAVPIWRQHDRLQKKLTGSIPQFYDSYLVPMIFESYATDLANRVVKLAPSSVLETATGAVVSFRARWLPGRQQASAMLRQT